MNDIITPKKDRQAVTSCFSSDEAFFVSQIKTAPQASSPPRRAIKSEPAQARRPRARTPRRHATPKAKASGASGDNDGGEPSPSTPPSAPPSAPQISDLSKSSIRSRRYPACGSIPVSEFSGPELMAMIYTMPVQASPRVATLHKTIAVTAHPRLARAMTAIFPDRKVIVCENKDDFVNAAKKFTSVAIDIERLFADEDDGEGTLAAAEQLVSEIEGGASA